MLTNTIALSLVGFLWHAPPKDVTFEKFRVAPGWVLEVRRDRFLNASTCVVRSRRVSYASGLVTFQFDGKLNTAEAVYRIDQGPPRAAADVAVASAGLGARHFTGNLRNPSGGRVFLPMSQLEAASMLEVRPNPKKRSRAFKLQGLQAGVAEARRQQCA